MADQIYKALARVFGVVLPLAGVGALVGGGFAHRFVADQLGAEDITIPDAETIKRELKIGLVTPADAELLSPHAGVTLTTGPQARIYADNYVLAHMRVAANQAGVPASKATYAGVGELTAEKSRQLKAEISARHPDKTQAEVAHLAKAEIADPDTEYDTARMIKSLQELRSDNFFMGNAIRGMLLNAYGWWLVGFVARVAGGALIAMGAVLAAIGFFPDRRR